MWGQGLHQSQSWKYLPARMRVFIFLFKVGGPLSSLPEPEAREAPGPCPAHPIPALGCSPATPTSPTRSYRAPSVCGFLGSEQPPTSLWPATTQPHPAHLARSAVPFSHTRHDQQQPLPGVGLLLTCFTWIRTPKPGLSPQNLLARAHPAPGPACFLFSLPGGKSSLLTPPSHGPLFSGTGRSPCAPSPKYTGSLRAKSNPRGWQPTVPTQEHGPRD